MVDTGAVYPGTVATQAVAPEDDKDWTDPNNIKANDAANAVASAVDTYTYRIKATNFGFAIPTGATIDGILVEVEKVANTYINDYRVQLLDANGSLVGDNKADTVTDWANAIISYGGATDKWNASPTEAMIEDVDFGIVLSAQSTPAFGAARIDFIRMTIYYTEAGGGAARGWMSK